MNTDHEDALDDQTWRQQGEPMTITPEALEALIDRIVPEMQLLADNLADDYPAEYSLALDRARIRRELFAALYPLLATLEATQAENVRLREALTDAKLQLEFVNEKEPRGSTEAILARIRQALSTSGEGS